MLPRRRRRGSRPSCDPPSRTISIADLVSELKTSSSKWLKERSPDLAKFSWQRGYGSFSIGPRDLDAVIQYIDNQEEHHRTKTFQDEYRIFLWQYGIVSERDRQVVIPAKSLLSFS